MDKYDSQKGKVGIAHEDGEVREHNLDRKQNSFVQDFKEGFMDTAARKKLNELRYKAGYGAKKDTE